jgi:uncharacterized Zn finger protein
MTSTFLHEDRPRSPDDVGPDKPVFCDNCGNEMWMMNVEKNVSDAGIDGFYRYECKHCGLAQTIHSHSDNPERPKIVPDLI